MSAGRRPSGSQCVLLALDLLRGLADLHALGVVMADLKPDNVLLDDTGQPLLCDFGLSRAVTSTVGQRGATMSPQGTYVYM
jgi:serine/threonine protein kinase